MGRAAARESLFKLIYEYTVREERDDFTLSLFGSGMNADDYGYMSSCYDGILGRAEELARDRRRPQPRVCAGQNI